MKKQWVPIFSVLSFFGLPLFYLPVAAAIWMLDHAAGVRIFASLLSIEAIGAAIKLVHPTERPVPMPRRTLREKIDAGSFPSLHSARIAALALTIFRLQPTPLAGGALVALILAVSASRLSIKKHYPLDVVAGIAGGIIINIIIFSF